MIMMMATIFASCIVESWFLGGNISDTIRGQIACSIDQSGSCTQCPDDLAILNTTDTTISPEYQCPEWSHENVTRVLQSQAKTGANLAIICMLYAIGAFRYGLTVRKHIIKYKIAYVWNQEGNTIVELDGWLGASTIVFRMFSTFAGLFYSVWINILHSKDNPAQSPIQVYVCALIVRHVDRSFHPRDMHDADTIAVYVNIRTPRHWHRSVHPKMDGTLPQMLAVCGCGHTLLRYNTLFDNSCDNSSFGRIAKHVNAHTLPP